MSIMKRRRADGDNVKIGDDPAATGRRPARTGDLTMIDIGFWLL